MTAGKYALVVLSRFEQGANVDFMAVVYDSRGGHNEDLGVRGSKYSEMSENQGGMG